jgi:hypothetical protein
MNADGWISGRDRVITAAATTDQSDTQYTYQPAA